MKILYVDDSGTKNYLEEQQPFYVFCGPLLDNSNRNLIEDQMQAIIDECKRNIQNKIYKSLTRAGIANSHASKLSNFIFQKIIPGRFEIHTTKLIRGDEEFMVLDRAYRESIVHKVLNLVKVYNIKVIAAICDKRDIANDKSMKIEDKNTFIQEKTSSLFIDGFEKYLHDIDSEAIVVIDSGSDTVKKVMKPYIWSKSGSPISHEVVEYESHLSPLMQLADVCAYTVTLHEKVKIPGLMSSDYAALAERLFDVIKDNVELIYVSDIYYPNPIPAFGGQAL